MTTNNMDATSNEPPASKVTVKAEGAAIVSAISGENFNLVNYLTTIAEFKKGGKITLTSEHFLAGPSVFGQNLVTIGNHPVNDIQVFSN